MAKLTRKQLAEVFPNHELIKVFERIDQDTDTTFPVEIAVAQSTADAALNLATGQALGVFDPRERVFNLRAVDGVNVTQDAAGYIFSIDLGFVINAAKAFLSHTFQVTAEAIRYALGYTPAPIDSPNFTGIPTAPTAAAGTNTTQIATTAHVFAERTNVATLTNKTINLSSNTLIATSAQLAAALTDETGTGSAVFAGSPALTGTPTAPTAAFGTDTTQIATTAFVQDVVTGPAFSAYQSSVQNVTSGVDTKVQLQTEEFDTAGAFDSTTNYRFQPSVAGYYFIDGHIQLGATATYIIPMIFKNGAVAKNGPTVSTASSGAVGALIFLNGSSDYVELYVQIGVTQDLATGARYTYFQAHLARAS